MKRIIGIVFVLTLVSSSLYFRTASTQTTTTTEDLATFQLTSTSSTDIFINSVSDDGRRVVFESTQNFSGGNGDANREIFMYDADLNVTFQLTATTNKFKDDDPTKELEYRVTNSSPAISGDGTRVVFTSNSGTLDGANDASDSNQEIFVAIVQRGSVAVTHQRITRTTSEAGVKENADNYSPAINRDGSVIAFLSTRAITATNTGTNDPLDASGTRKIGNTDGSAEIYLYKAGAFFQVTSRLDSDAVNGFTVLGFNASPFLSGDGKVLAFVSGHDYARSADTVKNTDFNGEIFVYRDGVAANTFTQVTATTVSDSINVTNGNDPTFPDPIIRTARIANILSAGCRHLSRDGKYLVFESSGDLDSTKKNTDKSREVFLYDTVAKTYTNITDQKPTLADPPTAEQLRNVDFGFRPSINPAGTFIAFGSYLDLAPVTTDPKTDNTDRNREVFTADIRNLTAVKFRQVSITRNIGNIGRELDEREITVIAWPNETANAVTFTASTDPGGNNSDKTYEVFQTVIRPVTTVNSVAATAVNAASYEPAPSGATTPPTVARGSTVAIFGTQLANALVSATSANLPIELGGVNVTVAGIPARLVFVSPLQVNFQMPPGAPVGDSIDFTVYNNGVLSRGKAKIADIAPGIYTASVTGAGPAAALCLAVTGTGDAAVATYSVPPCAISTDAVPSYLVIFGTGWRNGAAGSISVQVQKDTATAVTLTPTYAGVQPDFQLSGLDQINVQLPKDLATGVLKLSVLGTGTIKSRDGVEITIK